MVMIFTLTGASGAGKSTIGELLRKRFGDILKPVISVTTREPRDADPSGEYAYVSVEEFQKMKCAGEFIWDACPHRTDYYGTLFRSLEETNNEPNTIFLMVLEPDSVGTLHLKGKKMDLKIHSFYIVSPSLEDLHWRLVNRARQEREKKMRKMRADGVPEPEIWLWLKDKAVKDRVALKGRIQDCLKWDDRALRSKIPYVFVRNNMADLGQEAAATVAAEIVERMSA
ncbi:MAG: hypothetical protein HYT67_00550 [Candidatus Yanofskybacteria bacterium]|nr:hypothetical protein [Candidatus Yanofskybacteria bacterium]